MSKYEPSLEERKRRLLDEMMSAGAGGFSGSADPAGPVAGFDPVMGPPRRRSPLDKVLSKVKKKKKKD